MLEKGDSKKPTAGSTKEIRWREDDNGGAFMSERACLRVHQELTETIDEKFRVSEEDRKQLHSETATLFKKADWVVGGVLVAAGSALGLLVTAVITLMLHGGFAGNESVNKFREQMLESIHNLDKKVEVITTRQTEFAKKQEEHEKRVLEEIKNSDFFRLGAQKKDSAQDKKSHHGG